MSKGIRKHQWHQQTKDGQTQTRCMCCGQHKPFTQGRIAWLRDAVKGTPRKGDERGVLCVVERVTSAGDIYVASGAPCSGGKPRTPPKTLPRVEGDPKRKDKMSTTWPAVSLPLDGPVVGDGGLFLRNRVKSLRATGLGKHKVGAMLGISHRTVARLEAA